jgi:hypothetical protein
MGEDIINTTTVSLGPKGLAYHRSKWEENSMAC